MKFSVCLDAVFHGRDTVESMKALAAAGINTVEFWAWWEKDLSAIQQAREELGINISAFCTKFVSLVDAGLRQTYLIRLEESIEAARKLGCAKLITQVGNTLEGTTKERQRQNLIEGLAACVPLLSDAGVTLLVEPINTKEAKDYFLYSSEEAFDIVGEVGSSFVKVLFDIYHQQIMEGDLITRITENIGKIGHFHAAGNPGRHELHTGEIYYPDIFKAIDQSGFDGYMGLEYFPLEPPLPYLQNLAQKFS
ncbi:MAG: TIM barrel protein [Clostridiales bacterium]|jgi:hydroxypyruvate isomerase|nr:TIM barrel protein [Clostridiales bacterium]